MTKISTQIKPPDDLLEKIGFDDKSGRTIEMVFSTFPPFKPDCYCTENIIDIVSSLIAAYYVHLPPNHTLDEFNSKLNAISLLGPSMEALTNAMEHGNKYNPAKKMILGIWLGEKGIIFAIKDEGDWIKNNQESIERRETFSSTRERGGGGAGLGTVYETDEIRMKDNVLFLVLLKETFLV